MNIAEVVINLMATASMIVAVGGPMSVVKEVSALTADACTDVAVASAVQGEFGKDGEDINPALRNACFGDNALAPTETPAIVEE